MNKILIDIGIFIMYKKKVIKKIFLDKKMKRYKKNGERIVNFQRNYYISTYFSTKKEEE